MIKSVTGFGRSGLHDWVVQRATAVIIALYVLALLGFFLSNGTITYQNWHSLFTNTFWRVFSLLFLISLALHAWVGMWTIYTDYIKPTALRLLAQLLTVIGLFACVIWGGMILWGV